MPKPITAAMTILLALAFASAGAGAGAGATPVAAAATSCKPPKYPGEGYFTSLAVTNASCTRGSKLALAFYRCRTKNGRKGRCTKKVLGFSCTEKRTSIPTEINGRVTCKNGSVRIVHTYQQNL